MIRRLLSLLALIALNWGLTAHAETNWPRWRGPHENGHSDDTQVPVKWSSANVAWKATLKGIGQSSPIVWGERIYMTSALENGKQRLVFCLDRKTGKPLWEHVAWTGTPEESHKMNGWASATCVTDGEVVIAFFGRGGLHGYTVDGKHLWSRDLGQFKSPWGVASCPMIYGDLVVQNGDSEENAFITGIDKRTGKTVWSTSRPENRGWSTPILVETSGRQELVINGHSGVFAYAPKDGQQLWFCKSFSGRGEPTVTPAPGGVLCVLNGLSGDTYAIRPGGAGDVTSSHMAWHTPRKTGRDCPSPIVIGNQMLAMDMKGVLTAYDTNDGKEVWKHRVGGNFSASPIAANGLAYFIAEDGKTVVVKPGAEPNIVAENELRSADDEIFRASLTPHDHQLLIRSTYVLYCVGQK